MSEKKFIIPKLIKWKNISIKIIYNLIYFRNRNANRKNQLQICKIVNKIE